MCHKWNCRNLLQQVFALIGQKEACVACMFARIAKMLLACYTLLCLDWKEGGLQTAYVCGVAKMLLVYNAFVAAAVCLDRTSSMRTLAVHA